MGIAQRHLASIRIGMRVKSPAGNGLGCQPGRIAMNKEIQVLLLADDVAVEEGHDLAAGAGLRGGEFGL